MVVHPPTVTSSVAHTCRARVLGAALSCPSHTPYDEYDNEYRACCANSICTIKVDFKLMTRFQFTPHPCS